MSCRIYVTSETHHQCNGLHCDTLVMLYLLTSLVSDSLGALSLAVCVLCRGRRHFGFILLVAPLSLFSLLRLELLF